jgi:aspartate kinase
MSIVVQKYGGSSVADVAKLRSVASQIAGRRRNGDQLVVVVSAMGKTTDELISLARQVAPEPPRRELDMLVTAGERIAMALLTMAIEEQGAPAISFTGSQSGIITEDSHQGARILEVRPVRIQEELAHGKVVIVAGYQGVSTKREITTLGRGGSDTTAVALAAALAAESCEIYSDVDGVYTADPRVCPQARHIPELSYEVMQTLAGAGAKVLNAQAVEFAKKAGITIAARKTGEPDGRQTLVRGTGGVRGRVVAVTSDPRVTRLSGRCSQPHAVLPAVLRAGGRPIVTRIGAEDLDLLVSRIDLPGYTAAPLERVAAEHGLTAQATAAVTAVGTAIMTPELLDAFQDAARGDSLYANDTWLTTTVAPALADEAVRALHIALL